MAVLGMQCAKYIACLCQYWGCSVLNIACLCPHWGCNVLNIACLWQYWGCNVLNIACLCQYWGRDVHDGSKHNVPRALHHAHRPQASGLGAQVSVRVTPQRPRRSPQRFSTVGGVQVCPSSVFCLAGCLSSV